VETPDVADVAFVTVVQPYSNAFFDEEVLRAQKMLPFGQPFC
jgi:hypothetical protein